MPLNPELYRRPVRLPDGVTLSAIDIRPGGAKRTLVLLHGFGGSAAQWELVLKAFGDRHRCIALDLRGHGRSEKPASKYTMAEQLDDLEAALDGLRVEGPVVLWGHSFGGALATEFALKRPERVERLILSSATGRYAVGAHIALFFRMPSPFLEFVRGMVHLVSRTSWNAPAHVLKPLYLGNLSKWQGWERYRGVRVPTLVLNGARDYLFSRADLHRVAREVPGAEHVEIAASYHNIMLDRSDAVVRAVERFIGQTTSWRGRAQAAAAEAEKPWLARYESGVPPSVAVPDQPLHRLLEQAGQRHGGRVALVFAGGRIRYRRLLALAQRFAGLLKARGLRRGDRVLLALPNAPPLVFGYYGTLMAGGTVVLGNPLTAPAELARQALDSGVRFAVVPTALPEHAAALREAGLELVLETRLADWGGAVARALARDPPVRHGPDLARLLAKAAPARPEHPEPDSESVAVIAYTSGTTDEPKGVMLTHRALVANTLQLRHWIPDAREGREVLLAALPLTHSYGMTACMNLGVSLAGTLVLLPRFDVDATLRTIERHQPTLLPGVPPIYNALAHHPRADKKRLRSIRVCVSGAAPLPVEVQEGFERVTRARLVEGYGLTEAGPVTHANPLNGRRKTGSIGLPLPGTDAKVVDLDTGAPCKPGEVGELLVSGPQLMEGYWNRPDDTAAAFTKDRWLRTGDLAVMDAEGYFSIVDRKKDMVQSGRLRIYPRDIEEILYEHPKVFEAAVVGRSTEADAKPLLKAFVVLKRGESSTPDEILEHCRRRLQAALVPEFVEFRDDLPKSFVGKVLRRLLMEDPARPR